MPDALWWLPSVILLTVVGAAVTAIILAVRRRVRAKAQLESTAAAQLTRSAAISLVRADDLVQSAADELDYAVAQFGEEATAQFADVLATSRTLLRDAFALQQKLDDAEPESDLQRQRWSQQIIALADEATARLTEQTHDFDAKRGIERDAPLKLEQLPARLEHAREQVDVAASTLKRLGDTFAQTALVPIRRDLDRARTELDTAKIASDVAAAKLASGSLEPVGDTLRQADRSVFRATELLEAITAGGDDMRAAQARVTTVLAAADLDLANARELRDHHEETDTSSALNGAIRQADEVLARLREPGRLSDPTADLASVRDEMDNLDVAAGHARNRQLRLDNARTALHGAILAAGSQIQATRGVITANRARVGAAARTRLAEAERQLSLAEAEADPVTALDTARRAMSHATDADALARYDLL